MLEKIHHFINVKIREFGVLCDATSSSQQQLSAQVVTVSSQYCANM